MESKENRMSVIGLDATESALVESTQIDTLTYIKEIAGNRVYHFFEAPKVVLEIFVKGFGVTNAALGSMFGVLNKLVKTENIIFFAQDVIALPGQCAKFSERAFTWWNGNLSLKSLVNDGRKLIAHIGSTVGDYVDACSALQNLGVNVSSINKISDKVGSIGSALGAVSRIADYAANDTDAKPAHALQPQLESVRKPIEESRDLWNLSKDVSVLALSVLSLTVGFSALPAILSIGLPGMILGSRMTAYYHELQLKAIDSSYVQMVAAKKVLKG
jgi:hypothetical protein